MNIDQILFQLSIWAIPVLLAITVHEAAHGWVAWRCGDDTAYQLGRVTFNPLKHVDPFGTLLLPALLLLASGGAMMFGFAKPVPVNFRRLRHPRRDGVLVAAAGPGVNFLMALVAALMIDPAQMLPRPAAQWAQYNLVNGVWLNMLLAVFNMLPIPPLDGGRVAVGLLPSPLGARLARMERYGLLIVLFGVFLLPFIGSQIGVDLHVFSWLVARPASWLSDVVLSLAGVGSL